MNITGLSISIGIVVVFIVAFVFKFVFNIQRSKTKQRNKGRQNVSGNGNVTIQGNVQGDVNINTDQQSHSNRAIYDDRYDFDLNMLFIDDEDLSSDDFLLIKMFNKHGYGNAHKIKDADNLNQIEIQNAKIIFVDISGVGSNLGCKDGTELAVKIKKRFPEKIVAIYSSTESHNIMVKGMELLDNKFGKNDDFQLYLDFVEQYAKRNQN